MKIKNNSVVAVDLDKTLCTGENFTDADCIKAIPIQKMIDVVNNTLFRKKHCFIVIYTARREHLRTATEYWLRKYDVKYHTLVCGKLWAKYYIDDRNILIKDLLGGERN